jgi:hypothetical protein
MVCFFKFLTLFILGDHNFLISNSFLTIVSVSRGGVQVLFRQNVILNDQLLKSENEDEFLSLDRIHHLS